MKRLKRNAALGMAVFVALVLFSPQAFASGVGGFTFELPPTSQGQGIGNDAAGQRLVGEVIVLWSNFDEGTLTADAKILAELTHGNDTNSFSGAISGFPVYTFLTDPTYIQTAIQNTVLDSEGRTVLEYFFGYTGLAVTLTSAEWESSEIFADGSNIVLVHITASVK